ncbi:MAG: phosphomethylpyrimidine synthase ThiC [Thermodesulfobacteriota bacterium]|nr:phosphomethylpyrimidine synthase ThiC [Thermodesulfobacteriota bacterium]
MTQLSEAREGVVTEAMKQVADQEGVSPEVIRLGVAAGEVVIPKNIKRNFKVQGIGKGLRTKVNANIGTSPDHADLETEHQKLKAAIHAGADSVMDLSTGGDLQAVRDLILSESPVMVGAVPVYAVAAKLGVQAKPFYEMTPDMLFDSIEQQCEQGLDYITVHCGVTRESSAMAGHEDRVAGIVSRGGALTAAWMHHNDRENPLYEDFDRLLEIAFAYDVTLSLGDGLRPGAVVDASDSAQFQELVVLGRLAERARTAGVQVMIEGPGHVPLNQVTANMEMEKHLCGGAPFYVLGPLTTDCAPGYDHITAAIGGALAASAGADFLCYVTPSEHLCLPNVEDVRLGVVSARIAAHSGDIAKGVPGALERDIQMSKYRKALDWEGMYKMAIDPHMPKMRRAESETSGAPADCCTMCGNLCAVDTHNRIL